MFKTKVIVINIITTRSLHTTLPLLVRGPGRRANPGAAYQLKAIQSNEELTNDFADAESDFMHVHKTHRQHEDEMRKQREQSRLWVVKQKYFKEKLPNFLTYAEKEQIKLLHARDPEEWNAEKLAESFPVTTELVNKILRASWRPHSVKRLRQHDEAVIKNWELLCSGGFLELQPVLREHLMKFADRTSDDLKQKTRGEMKWQARPKLPKPTSDEFSSIITSCKKYAEQQNIPLLNPGKAQKAASTIATQENESEDTYLMEKIRDKRYMRIQELKSSKLNCSEMFNSRNVSVVAELEQRAARVFINPNGTGILPKEYQDLDVAHSCKPNSELIEKFQSKEIVISQEDRRRFEMTTVKDRIYIPKKLRSKGATYKVDDCYYDDDGEFLYRVPGMTG